MRASYWLLKLCCFCFSHASRSDRISPKSFELTDKIEFAPSRNFLMLFSFPVLVAPLNCETIVSQSHKICPYALLEHIWLIKTRT